MSHITPLNPATGEPLETVKAASVEEVRSKIALARRAQAAWKEKSLHDRASALKRFSEILAHHEREFADLITEETGKPRVDALTGEILPSLLWIDYVRRHAPKLLRTKKLSTHWLLGHESMISYDPLGVVGIITPWNFPVYITLSSAIPALAAGNAVITKPSRFTPLSVLKLEGMFNEARFPAGIFQVVSGDGGIGTALVQAGVDKIVFTGSVEVGRKLSAACAEKLIPCTLELGGKDPMIVLDDAPMPRAVHGALYGGLCHAGQLCMSIERIYVTEKIAPEFLRSLVSEMKRLVAGRDVGPLQSEEQLLKVESQVKDAVNAGATLLVGGARSLSTGFHYAPTVLLDVPEKSRMHDEESFGPVFYVKIVRDEDEAIRLSNESRYGLTASIWSNDIVRAKRLTAKLQAGSVFINDHITPAGNPAAPWGGVKESGLGVQGGEWGIYDMARVRHIARARRLFPKDLFWFPRTRKQEQLASGLIQGLFSPRWIERLKGIWKAFSAYFQSSS